MSLTPTPLSGCPLRRLEIRDGSTCNTYDAIQSESSLTATLEARRSMAGNTNDMVLQSHLGLDRLVSIQLTDLISSSNNTTEIVAVDRPSHRMSVQLHQKKQTILFTFKETRDFNVITYALKKFGFRIKDGISLSPHADAISLARSQSSPVSSSKDFAPRLSCITPLERHGDAQALSPFSFTSLLNSDIPLTQVQSMGAQHRPIQSPPQDLSQQSVHQVIPTSTYAPYPNFYQLHLGHQGNMYQPRVSSPLRNAVEVNSRDMTPISFMPNSRLGFFSNATATDLLLSHRSISEPNVLSQPWQQQECMNTNRYESPSSQESPQASQDTVASTGNSSQTTDEPDIPCTLQPTRDYRELMPRTRNLPFVKDSKSKTSGSKSVQKRARMEHSLSANNSDLLIEDNVASDLDIDRTSASQTNLRPTSSQSTDSQANDALKCHSFSEMSELPAMLITDNNLLEGINQVTSNLLDQFNADIARGCDDAACAQYYLEQIDTARRDFWLSQLEQINYM